MKATPIKRSARSANEPAIVYALENGCMNMVDIIPSELIPTTQEGIDELIKFERAANHDEEILVVQGKTPIGHDMTHAA